MLTAFQPMRSSNTPCNEDCSCGKVTVSRALQLLAENPQEAYSGCFSLDGWVVESW